ncbi:MAG TPA: ABC transporter permease [Blastocatellia bacterium]|nr:ABC transporter permease [Blastocatellia bacterium]
MKNPGFTLIAVVTLALGIGAATAIFTIVNAVLLRQLPYPQAERIVAVGAQFSSSQLNAVDDPRFLFWHEHQKSFEALAAHMGMGGVNLTGDGLPELVSGQRVSADFFHVMGVAPAVGRSFTPEEDRNGGAKVAVLSDALWRRRYGGDSNLIGNPAPPSVYFAKHFRYWYQQEYRVVWTPPTPIAKLPPLDVEMGNLKDICEIICLNK